jgi:predicted Fe-Mo cluster-binding NifX family protein
MRIAISTSGDKKESNLDRRFGRCEYFLIYDTEKDSYEAIPNEGIDASGGAGIKAASQIIDAKADVIITGNLGPNAFELIEKAGIKGFTCEIVPAFKALELFQKGNLLEISNAGMAHHGIH